MIQEQNKISVIIPVYDAEKFIERCINSILNQSYKNLEIIIVDDGSKDNTKVIVEKLICKDKRIVYVWQENAGVSAARNKGIQCSSGEFLTFVDADDWLEFDALEKMVRAFAPDIGFVCCGTYMHRNGEAKAYSPPENLYLSKDETLYSLYSDSYVRPVVWGKLYLSKMIKGKLSFATNIAHAEDIKFVSDFSIHAKKTCVLKYCGYHYQMDNADSAMHKLRDSNAFDMKFVSSWLAYTEMEKSLQAIQIDKRVYKRFLESKVECGKSCLKILYNYNQDTNEMVNLIKKDMVKHCMTYIAGKRQNVKGKISTMICILMPPCINRILRG